ncbi:hypothetical protein Tco_0202543 [Tanacetum coccineum]
MMKLNKTPQEKGEGEGDDADLERAIKLSLDPAFLPQGRAHVGGVTIRDPVLETTSKLHEVVGKGKAVVTEEQVAHSLINLSKKKLCKADLKGPAFNLVKAFHKNNVFFQYQMDECHKLLTNKVDLSNPKGHQILQKYI